MSKKYTLHLTEKQARVIVNALDLYSRIGMGQFSEVVNILRMNTIFNSDDTDHKINDRIYRMQRLRESLEDAARNFHGGSGYHGILSEVISDVFRTAWDIQQVIRHRLAWDRNPNGDITVDFDKPMKTTNDDLPIIVRVDDEQTASNSNS